MDVDSSRSPHNSSFALPFPNQNETRWILHKIYLPIPRANDGNFSWRCHCKLVQSPDEITQAHYTITLPINRASWWSWAKQTTGNPVHERMYNEVPFCLSRIVYFPLDFLFSIFSWNKHCRCHISHELQVSCLSPWKCTLSHCRCAYIWCTQKNNGNYFELWCQTPCISQ